MKGEENSCLPIFKESVCQGNLLDMDETYFVHVGRRRFLLLKFRD